VILSAENVARRPGNLSTKECKGFDKHGSLNGHAIRGQEDIHNIPKCSYWRHPAMRAPLSG